MIIVNKQTRKERKIDFSDFQKEFKKDIQMAFESYKIIQSNKKYYGHILNNDNLLSDFNFNLQWNFNHLSKSVWYIKSI